MRQRSRRIKASSRRYVNKVIKFAFVTNGAPLKTLEISMRLKYKPKRSKREHELIPRL